MGLQANLTALFQSGPGVVTDSQFPSGVTTIPFGLNPPQKQFNVDTGVMRSMVNSPSSYSALGGIGPASDVSQATTLIVRTQVQMLIRMTFANPAGGSDIVSVEPISGTKMCEYPANGYLKLLEVQGQGQLEYYACGLQ
jgi:hypothetical protein